MERRVHSTLAAKLFAKYSRREHRAMSRVGKKPIEIPAGVQCAFDNGVFSAKGKNGQLTYAVSGHVLVSIEEGKILVAPASTAQKSRAMWGTTQRLVGNLVKGVSEGFTKRLEINGVGYRAAVQGSNLVLQLGYSHDVIYPIPEGISIACEKPTAVAISGARAQQVGQVAAEIRSFRPPEPYKGKGVRYEGEKILRKEGKKK